jgi:hypothetical protein
LVPSGGIRPALLMPLGSDSTLGLAGPNGTPEIAELPAPAEPAGGTSCAKTCSAKALDAIGPANASATAMGKSAEVRDIRFSPLADDATMM